MKWGGGEGGGVWGREGRRGRRWGEGERRGKVNVEG